MTSRSFIRVRDFARCAARYAARCSFLGLLVLLCATDPRSTARAAEGSTASTTTPVILVLGDSISAEYGLPRDSGWVHLLDARLRERHDDYHIVNASISGETTSGGRARIDELLGRVKPAIVVVELGGNDALRGLPLEDTRRNLDDIVVHAQKAGAKVLIIGMQIPPNYGKVFADRFAGVFSDIAKSRNAALTPFFFAGFADRFDLFQADRIHPTVAAQPRLLDNVWPALEPLLKRGRR
jgi:acyl-CoA thioesterase-1